MTCFLKTRKSTIFSKYVGSDHNLPVADCMSFSYNFKTLRSGNSYNSRAQIEMSVHEGKVTEEIKTGTIEGNEENGVIFSPDLVDERIKVGLEPLHGQISTLTELMDRLIQIN